MSKKITIVLLIILLFILGWYLFKNKDELMEYAGLTEDDVDILMKYVDCDELYVGTYSGWLKPEYTPLSELGHGFASQVIDVAPFPESGKKFPLAIFVDIDSNIKVQGLLNEHFLLEGKVNSDGNFELTKGYDFLSGQFEWDEELQDMIVTGEHDILYDFGGYDLKPNTTLYASGFDITAKCIDPEAFYNIEFGNSINAHLEQNSDIKQKEGIRHYQGHGFYSLLCENFKEEKDNILTPHAVIFVRSCPAKFVVNVEKEKTVVFVEQGEIEIQSLDGEKSITLTNGQMVIIMENHFPEEVFDLFGG